MMALFGSNLCEDQRAPFELSVTTATITAMLCIITVPGNVLICWAIVKDPNKELKTSFNYLVMNLAIADLISGLVTEPSFVVFHVREAQRYEVMNRAQIVHIAYFISCTASMLSISALAIERYLTVTSTYRRTCSRSKTIGSSILIWIFSITVSNIYFATGFYTFLFVFANTTIIATLVIITCAYIKIYQSLHAHVERRGATTQNDPFTQQRLKYEKKATKSFLLVLFVFICCNVSSCVMVYTILLCDVCSCDVIHWLRDFQFLMALVNCAANQFLYAWRMPMFVRTFKLLLSCAAGSVRRRRVQSCSGPLPLSSLTVTTNDTFTTDRSICTENLSAEQRMNSSDATKQRNQISEV